MLYALLKDGRKMVVWSDNTERGDCTCYEYERRELFDPEYSVMETIPYDKITRMSRDVYEAFGDTLEGDQSEPAQC